MASKQPTLIPALSTRLACISLSIAVMVMSTGPGAAAAPLTQALFTFGDSLVDVGNNNYIPTLARANFPYNGIDYPGGIATGRFCNGETVLDILSELIGFEISQPPYLQPDIQAGGPGILQGVNYASAAAGILNDTGLNYITNINLDEQISFFQNTTASLQAQLGNDSTETLLRNNSLFAIVIGSNDYINNYLLPFSFRSFLSPSDYQNLLISNLQRQLTTIYSLGARQFVVVGLGPLGCIPSQILQNGSNGTCVDRVNQLASGFNSGLQTLLQQLRSQFPDAAFLYANTYDFVLNLINNPAPQGFNNTNAPCCSAAGGYIPCVAYLGATVCPDRPEYIFWDPFHPTERVNRLLAPALFTGGTQQISPINVRELLTGTSA